MARRPHLDSLTADGLDGSIRRHVEPYRSLIGSHYVWVLYFASKTATGTNTYLNKRQVTMGEIAGGAYNIVTNIHMT